MMFLRKCKVRENNRDTGVTAGGVLRFSSGEVAVVGVGCLRWGTGAGLDLGGVEEAACG